MIIVSSDESSGDDEDDSDSEDSMETPPRRQPRTALVIGLPRKRKRSQEGMPEDSKGKTKPNKMNAKQYKRMFQRSRNIRRMEVGQPSGVAKEDDQNEVQDKQQEESQQEQPSQVDTQ